MSTRKNYTVDEVVKSLKNKHDVKIDIFKKRIEILNGKDRKYPRTNDLGNGSQGKLDYLTNHCGFTKFYVSEFTK